MCTKKFLYSVYQEVLAVCVSGSYCSLCTRGSRVDGEVDGTGRLFSPSAFYSYVHRIGFSVMIRQYSSRVAARQRRKIYSTYLCGQNVTSVILQASRGQRAGRGEEQKLLSTYYTTSRGRLRCGYLQIRFRKFNFYSRENKTIEYIRNL